MISFGVIGLLLISYALWVKNEKRQDEIFLVGGAFLLAYSIFIGDKIFVALQIVFMVSALAEILKIRKK